MTSGPSPGTSRRTTLSDIAQLLDLDASTVSKVLSGSDAIKVKPATRERILRAALALDYRPHAGARSLRRQRTDIVGILMPDFTNPIYTEMIRGAVMRAESLGYAALVAGLATSDQSETYRRLVHEGRIDGLLVAIARADGELARELDRGSIPHVFMNRAVAGTRRNATIDDATAVDACLRLLADLGHEHVAIVDASVEFDTARRRLEAASRAALELGLPPVAIEEGLFSPAEAADATRRLLDREPRPTAVFCSNAYATVGVVSAIVAAGLAIPGDVSVVSVEDPELSPFLKPPLTSFELPYRHLGEAAMDSLDALMSGAEPADIVLPVTAQPILRASTAPPRG